MILYYDVDSKKVSAFITSLEVYSNLKNAAVIKMRIEDSIREYGRFKSALEIEENLRKKR